MPESNAIPKDIGPKAEANTIMVVNKLRTLPMDFVPNISAIQAFLIVLAIPLEKPIVNKASG